MSRMTKRVLTDGQWERVAPHLPVHAPSPKGGRPREDDRECLEGLLWLLRSGARWQDTTVELASGSTCWRRLQEWAVAGVLEAVQTALVEDLAELGELDFDALFADATFIRAKKGATTSGKPRSARV